MAQQSNKNFLNYTGLTHEEIETQVTNKIKADPRFANFTESSIAQTILEVFTGASDLTNYYLERRAEESYLDTAKLRSSVILLAKQLGYIIQRPIPAKSSITMRLYGDLGAFGILAGTTIPLTKFNTSFTYNGLKYILSKTLEYTITQDDINLGNKLNKYISYAYSATGVMIPDVIPTSAVETIDIMQGELKQYTITGGSNRQLGQAFQKYKIDDEKFSNLFGTEDVSYDYSTGNFDKVSNLTKVGISNDPNLIYSINANANNLFEIDRRSLINQESLGKFGDSKKLCLLRTTMDGKVELIFGDGNFAQLGPQTTNDNIYIQYLSTEGKLANRIGVIGNVINPNGNIITGGASYGLNISQNVQFILKKNITGGANLEDIDSIRYNAPSIYAALDRLITAGDYRSYLKSLTSPINVKNAIAWGEQEEARANKVKAIFRMFNVIFYSMLGEIYNIKDTEMSEIKPLSGTNSLQSDSILEGEEYNPNNVVSSDSYFNLFVRQSMPSEAGRLDFLLESHPIRVMYNKIKSKSQATCSNVYVSPLIQDFEVKGTVYVSKLSDKLSVRKRANNNVYKYLNEISDFHIPVYKSKVLELIEEIPEVEYVNLQFIPTNPELVGLGALNLEPAIVSYSTSASIINVIQSKINTYMSNAGYANTELTSGTNILDISEITREILPVSPWAFFGKNWVLETSIHQRVSNINERSFILDLVKPIYDTLISNISTKPFANSADFQEIVKKMHNSLWFTIKSSMLDENGNITNYSFRNEISRLNLANLTYVFIK